MLVEFHGMKFDLPRGWEDITDDLAEGGPPSLARPDGVGALQFTLAKYRGGECPGVTIYMLRTFLDEFFENNKLSLDEFVEYSNRVISVQGISHSGDEFILARYFSNGKDVMLATYVCPRLSAIEAKEDLKDVETIMESMEF